MFGILGVTVLMENLYHLYVHTNVIIEVKMNKELKRAYELRELQRKKDKEAMEITVREAYKKFNLLDVFSDALSTIVIENAQLRRIGRHLNKDGKRK